jgi:PAS domain S-box-containing protein
MRPTAYFLLALLLVPTAGQAQVDGKAHQVSYSQYGSSEGLPSDHVSEVVRDSLGFAWIGTDRGLVYWDGHRFMPVEIAEGKRPVTALHRRASGGVWLATEEGIFAAAPSGDTIAVRRLGKSGAASKNGSETRTASAGDSLAAPNGPKPNGLHEDTRGDLWVSRADGSVVRIRDGRLRSYALHAGHSGTAQILFAEDRRGRLWTLTPDGHLHRYVRARDQFEDVARLEGLDDPHALRIRHDTLWAAGDGLVRAQVTEDGMLARKKRFGAEKRTLTHVAFGPEGLLLGTQTAGLFRGTVGTEGLPLRRVYGANDPHRTTELPFQNIRHLYVDRSGTIWVSSDQGLGLLKVPSFQVPTGLPNYTTFSVHPEESGALLSLGDASHVSVGPTGSSVVRRVPVTTERSVTSVASASSASSAGATVWLGTSDGRLLTVESGGATRVRDLSGRGDAIFYLYDDRRGNLWFCQAPAGTPLKGVTRIGPDGELTFYDADDGLETRVLSLREGPEGRLYAAGIGPETYLHRYVPERDRFINLSRSLPFGPEAAFEAHDLAIGPQGTVWLATTAGLLRRGKKRTRRVDLGPFAETEIRAVEAMPNGDLWLAIPSQGLLHYRDGKAVRFGQDRGLISTQMMYRTLRTDGRGRLWAGTTVEGVAYSRDQFPVPDSTPAPILLSARSEGRPLKTSGRLTVSAQEGVALRYAALAFPANGSVQYQYRMPGTADSTWSAPSTNPTLRLRRVSASMRAVEIRARSGSGHYWSPVLRVPLRVRPVWYQRWWAYVLFGLGGASVIGGLVRLYVGRRQARKALRDREARLRGIANSIPGVVFQARLHPDGTYESAFVSEHAETLLGISADPEGFHARFADRIPEPHRDDFQASVEEALSAGTEWRHEMPFETPSGRRLWLLGASIPEQHSGETIYNGVILDITERKEREQLLKNEQEALQSMYRITADREAGFEAKVQRLLDLGRKHLDLPYGYLTRLSPEKQEVVLASGAHPLLQAGESCPLSQSYCRKTIREESSLVVQDAEEEGWAEDPAYETFGLGAYIGAQVIVEGELHGTFCFADEEAREKPFTNRERTFVELMAQWVSYELEQRRAKTRLERQNERLDSFASFVTHDLRNPLNVAMGRLQLAQNASSDPNGESDGEQAGQGPGHLAAVGRALTRMNDLIEDVMTLTWSEQTLGADDRVPCHLDEVATTSWNHVDTAQATLHTDDGLVLRAHEDRLQRLLENLFRNAIEHGGDAATIRVGGIGDGFFVEDDGPGIPADEREAVLREGYSSNEEGTGLGLSIVQSIAEAHGWSLSVTGSDAGGARFEVTGVETTDEVFEEG